VRLRMVQRILRLQHGEIRSENFFAAIFSA
jgi:hypothetical protein